MDTPILLAASLADEYGWNDCALVPLSGGPEGESWALRVEQEGVPVAVLRAQRTAWLDQLYARQPAATARLLAHLAARDYPAPRVIATRRGESWVQRGQWAIILLSHVAGTTRDYSVAGLTALAGAVGRLNALPIGEIGESWWSLDAVVSPLSERLAAIEGRVPGEWRDWYTDCLHELVAWPARAALPTTLIHADAWVGNAVVSPDGAATLIDWDLAGRGPAILDFASLLLHGHYDVPDCAPVPVRIAALVDGYCAHRRTTGDELAILTEAVRFGPAFRSALFFLAADEGLWGERPWRQLANESARYPAGPALADAARAHLAGAR